MLLDHQGYSMYVWATGKSGTKDTYSSKITQMKSIRIGHRLNSYLCLFIEICETTHFFWKYHLFFRGMDRKWYSTSVWSQHITMFLFTHATIFQLHNISLASELKRFPGCIHVVKTLIEEAYVEAYPNDYDVTKHFGFNNMLWEWLILSYKIRKLKKNCIDFRGWVFL